ncbi:MAG: FKBP-type peptidyl-prolyl cis-trans isomerase [Bacteroidota bacterium]|jgi:FKBP-type peptidyl-prolyl cis-trans isomerase|nr:FKBP-type peptidyl-prolyl cis-trans isomerase [Bacteroidota bacterium]
MNELKEKVSYAVGMSIAESLKSQKLDNLDLNMLKNGIEDVFENNTFKVNPSEANELIKSYMDEANNAAYGENKQKGIDYLKENQKRSEIKTTESGLQYEILTEAEGARPSSTDNVTVHYHGTLIDGTVFDSSVERGTPASFGVHQVIPGWTEALQLMNVGSKYRLHIPQELAYGANPHPGGPIEPFSALIFDVELLSIQ